MSRPLLLLNNTAAKAKAILWIERAPWNTRVWFGGPVRSLPQNDRFHAMLTDVADQLTWHGRKWPMADWKDFFKHALKAEARWMPGEDGFPVPVGQSSAEWTIPTMSDAMELIAAFGARHGVAFREPSTDSANAQGPLTSKAAARQLRAQNPPPTRSKTPAKAGA